MIKFLFLDYWPLEYVRNFQKRLNQPRKYDGNPIFRPEKPWEETNVQLYGTIIYDPRDALFKMWYIAYPTGEQEIHLCYATSTDGYHWQRPELDIYPWEGKPSNIVMAKVAHGPSVLLDDQDPDPSRRFKLIQWRHRSDGIYVYASPDGIHWRTLRDTPVLPNRSDSHLGLWRDPDTGHYVCTLRPRWVDRRVARSDSEDFIHWSSPKLIMEPDPEESPQTQFYGAQGFIYGPYTIAQISMFYTSEPDRRWSKMDGTMDVQLAFSRGGWCWHRVCMNERFIPNGLPGEWDAQMVIPATGPVLLDDRMLFYWAGTPYGHGETLSKQDQCIGVGELRIDGFVSLDVGEAAGELLTRPFALKKGDIFVNADASDGHVWVEVQREDGSVIPGFSWQECVPVSGDSVAHPVRWRGNPDLSAIERTPIRLRVLARRAKLYSIWMPNGDEQIHYARFKEIGCTKPLDDLQD